MSSFSNLSNRTKIIASIAIFSALYAVIRLIPMGPMIGFSGSFSVSDSLVPLYGILLGPYTGGISVVIGTFLAVLMGKPLVFMGLDFLPALVNVVAIGFLVKRKWMPVVILYTVLLSVFILSPYSLFLVQVPPVTGTLYIPFTWMHIVVLAILLSPLYFKAISSIESLKTTQISWALAILAFIGTMMQHLTGNLVFQLVLGQPIGGIDVAGFQGIWNVAFYAYPVERSVLVLITVLVGTPLVRTLKKSLFVGNKFSSKNV